MRAPLSWVRELVDLPDGVDAEALTRRLTMLGLKLESVTSPGEEIEGPLVVGRVLSVEPEPQKNGKTINWCTVDVGSSAADGDRAAGEPQGIVCGAHNFGVGDLVVVVLPGAVLPGGFAISARTTYGHVSAGMICSASELGLGEDAEGIVVLPEGAGSPGDDARRVLGLDDTVIELEVNPDRAYALSLRGIARDAALGFGVGFHDPAAREVPAANDDGPPLRIEDSAGCPVFVARTVSGFDPTAPTPDGMARRLTQAGMRPISLAVDITNYVMLELGRPIHAYDADRVAGTVGVRRARAGERLTTLDGVDRELGVEDLVVVDDSGVIGLGGVMGGADTEISAGTTRVLVESAHWDATAMFRTGRRHRITSEAGRRNERGVDPTICEAAADRVVALMGSLGGATADPGVTVAGAPPEPTVVRAAADLPARITGLVLDADLVVATLRAVGCEVPAGDGVGVLDVTVPPWRPDLTDPYDLVEEVVRVVGYDRVPSVLPPAPAGRGLSTGQRLRRRVGTALAGAGWTEVITYPFVGEEAWERLGLPGDDPRRRAVRIANPLNHEEPLLTTTLLPGILASLARNVGRGMGDVALFEHSLVARPAGDERAPILGVDRRPTDEEWAAITQAVPAQPLHLALAIAGDRQRAGWWGDGRAAAWSDAIAGVRDVAAALGVAVELRSASVAPWHPGRCAEVLVGGTRVVGWAGELHPRACRALAVPERTAVAEVDLDVLLQHAPAVVPAPRFSAYPVAKEDVAVVVDARVPVAAVEAALRAGAGPLLESVRLFDVYTGAQAGEGKKSLAFALRLRAMDRTLTDAEAAQARDGAVAAAAESCGAVLRS